MNEPRIIPPLRNPESTLGAALLQFFRRFSAVAVLGLLLGAAPRLLLLFVDNLPQLQRIDLLEWMLGRVQISEELLSQFRETIDLYREMGLFSVSPLVIVLSLLSTLAVTPLLNGCAARLTIDGFLGEQRETVDLLAEGKRRWPGLIVTGLCAALLSALLYGAAAVPTLLAVLVGVVPGLLLSAVGLGAMVLASCAVLCLGGMYAAVVMEEGKRGPAALVRTWKLARYRFFRNGWVLLIAALLTSYVTIGAQSLFYSASPYLGGVVSALVGGVAAVFLPMVGARCYIAARSRAAWTGPLPDPPPSIPEGETTPPEQNPEP